MLNVFQSTPLSLRERVGKHLAFWLIVIVLMTSVYNVGMPGYTITLTVVLCFIPLYMTCFYVLAYGIMPRYLYPRKQLKFVGALLVCVFFNVLAFRTIEITVADPFIYRIMVQLKGPFVWHKLDGSFMQQLLQGPYLVKALEQSSIVMLVAFSVKFFKMWSEKRQVALQAELDFLKAQIHPHFLFNTLNNLYSLTLEQSSQSPNIVLGLSNILRYMLYECNTDSVWLTRDVEILQNYVDLEKIRYEERLDLHFKITGNLTGHQVPPLLMLPLVENAFKHGAAESTEAPWINIELNAGIDNKLVFKISNSKPERKTASSPKQAGRIGLYNVRKRLELLYPKQHAFHCYEEEDCFIAELLLQLSAKKLNDRDQNTHRR